jgi:hypothetical protein
MASLPPPPMEVPISRRLTGDATDSRAYTPFRDIVICISRIIHPSQCQFLCISPSVGWLRRGCEFFLFYDRKPSIEGERLSEKILVSLFKYILFTLCCESIACSELPASLC